MSYVFVEADASSSTPFDGPFRLQLCSTLSLDCPDYVVDRGHAYYVRCVRDFSAVVSTGERTPQKFYPASGGRTRTYPIHYPLLFGVARASGDLYCQLIGAGLVAYGHPNVYIENEGYKEYGASVRCVRDLIGRVSASERMT